MINSYAYTYLIAIIINNIFSLFERSDNYILLLHINN